MPLKIAFLSKYPPLEGGIAAKTYWLARGLARRGHDVHVITQGVTAGGEYSIARSEQEPELLPNLWIHRLEEEIPWHIPDDPEYALGLLDLTIEVIQQHNIQILDTGYLVPYGIIGNLSKYSTNIPHIIRHGGSDIEKFLKKGVLGRLIHEAIRKADTVITEKHSKDLFEPLTRHIVLQPAYVPDGEMFKCEANSNQRKRLASIGKINYYWQYKGLDKIGGVMNQLSDQFECCFTGQGNGMRDFQDRIGSESVSRFKWYPFVPPWEMPALLRQLDAIFVFELSLPHPVISNLVLEAMCSGTGIITDRPDLAETYNSIVEPGTNQVLTVTESDLYMVARSILEWVNTRGQEIRGAKQLISYDKYLADNEAIYESLVKDL